MLFLRRESAGLVFGTLLADSQDSAKRKEIRFMDPTTNGATGSNQAGGADNIAQLQQRFNEFSQTLVQLRTVSTEGQQKLETARTRPQ